MRFWCICRGGLNVFLFLWRCLYIKSVSTAGTGLYEVLPILDAKYISKLYILFQQLQISIQAQGTNASNSTCIWQEGKLLKTGLYNARLSSLGQLESCSLPTGVHSGLHYIPDTFTTLKYISINRFVPSYTVKISILSFALRCIVFYTKRKCISN